MQSVEQGQGMGIASTTLALQPTPKGLDHQAGILFSPAPSPQ